MLELNEAVIRHFYWPKGTPLRVVGPFCLIATDGKNMEPFAAHSLFGLVDYTGPVQSCTEEDGSPSLGIDTSFYVGAPSYLLLFDDDTEYFEADDVIHQISCLPLDMFGRRLKKEKDKCTE